MIRFSTLKTALAVSITVIACSAFAEPAEVKVLKLTRTDKSDATLSGTVSKNLYRAEQYQSEYTVQIPYEAEEEYQEEIPYTVSVPYTEYVTDYRSEYVCHDVTKYKNEYSCHDVTDYRQTCRNEVQCYLVPGDRTCHEVTECGTNVHGEPICKTRTVCEDGSSTQRCEDRQVCSNEPYTRQECGYDQVSYTDRECGYEQVPYQREVSGYRDETRYRYETRTRTVTRYREETRCCETRTRQVFDRQLSYQVSVHFPQNAVLAAGDIEKLNIVLETATDKSATVSIQSVDTIWLYKIKSQSAAGAGINVELEATAQWDATTAGQTSIKNAVLNWAPTVKRFQFSFTDSVKNAKIASTYKVTVLDEKGKKLEEKTPVADANGLVNFLFEKVKDKKLKIKAVLQVTRTGRLLVGSPLNFQMEVALRPVE